MSMQADPEAVKPEPAMSTPSSEGSSSEMGERILEQAFELWIGPEITRRREAGSLPVDFELHAAQIIFRVESEAPDIRLNHEVRGRLHGRSARPIQKGEFVRATDFSEYIDLDLTSQDEDCGHLTLMRRPGHWWLKFDFSYNAGRIAQTIDAARQFLETAAQALKQAHYRPFTDALFSTTELLAKALLLSQPDKAVLASKRHDFVATRYNQLGKLGVVPKQYVALLNVLAKLRPKARYPEKTFSLEHAKAVEMLATAQDMLAFVTERSPKRRISETNA